MILPILLIQVSFVQVVACMSLPFKKLLRDRKKEIGYRYWGQFFTVFYVFTFFLYPISFLVISYFPQHFLYFSPLPHGHGSFRPTFLPFLTVVFLFGTPSPPVVSCIFATCSRFVLVSIVT